MTPTERDLAQARQLAIERGLPEGDDYAWIYQLGWKAAHNDAQKQHEATLLNERHRFVTDAVASITAYGEALTSALDDRPAAAAQRIIDHAIKAIRAVGCICPQINIGTLGDPDRTTRGLDPLCGVHGKDRT